MTYLSIIIGGVLGGILRYMVSFLPAIQSLPVNTTVVNLVGSFLLGTFYGIAEVKFMSPWVKLGVSTGVLGAFTTFSTFCMVINKMLNHSMDLLFFFVLLNIVGGPLVAFVADRLVVVLFRDAAQSSEELST